jgi:Na+/glutamate symporter
MSSHVGARSPRGAQTQQTEQLSPRNEQKARVLGLTSATGLVIGSIIGTGVPSLRE